MKPKLESMGILSKFSLEDRIAVVTGAGGGIGEGIALGFASAGAHVVVADLDAGLAEAVAGKVRALGRQALPVAIDATRGDQVQGMVDSTLAKFGRIDILVNNVGGTAGKRVPVLEMSEDIWDLIIRLNLKSTFLCTKIIGRVMKNQKAGNVINIASIAGEVPFPSMVSYGAAKAGIINFTRSVAVYLAPDNIRVNCIAPHTIDTQGTSFLGSPKERAERGAIPLGRVGYAEDVACAAIYLASDAAAFVTGSVIGVTGGPHLGAIILKQAEGTWKDKRSQ